MQSAVNPKQRELWQKSPSNCNDHLSTSTDFKAGKPLPLKSFLENSMLLVMAASNKFRLTHVRLPCTALLPL
jgi:hypothetical protein